MRSLTVLSLMSADAYPRENTNENQDSAPTEGCSTEDLAESKGQDLGYTTIPIGCWAAGRGYTTAKKKVEWSGNTLE